MRVTATATTPAAGSAATDAAPRWLRLAPGIFLLLWSGGFAVGEIGLQHAGPMTLLAVRYALVLGVLAPVLLLLRPPLPRGRAAWLHLAVVGLLIQAAYFGLGYAAMARGVSAGAVAVVAALQPVLVAALAPWLAGEAVGRRVWFGLALGFAGAVVVIAARSRIEAPSWLGLLSAVGALGGMTAGTLYEKRFGIAQHPVPANIVQHAVAIVALLPVAWATEGMRVEWTGGLLVALAYLVIGNSLIAITLLLAMVRRGKVSRVSALFFLVPPGAALIAWALLGEAMPPLGWGGLALATAGVALVARR